MRALLGFVKKTAIGGLIFLIPVALIVVVVGQVISNIRPAAEQIAGYLGPLGIGPVVLTIIAVLVLILVSFLAGLAASTVLGQRLASRIEGSLLDKVPGYNIIKSAAADAIHSMARIESSEEARAVLLKSGGGWRLAFIMGRNGDGYAIFVPGSPSADRGHITFVTADEFVDSGLKASEALICLRRLGASNLPVIPTSDA